jgi:type II secretory pathway pseudopilin PulG
MNVQQKNKETGFTIIEVVLVLAIAALIFLMVFIALPALQRSQRDTARKADVSSIAAGVTAFTSNNRGLAPSSTSIVDYVKDISDNTKTVTVDTTKGGKAGTVSPATGTATVYMSSKCVLGTATPKNVTLAKASASQFAVVTQLESGNSQYFCLDS